jgi:hypothetical protein
MLPTFSEITFAVVLHKSPLKLKTICTTTTGPDNNPFGYT